MQMIKGKRGITLIALVITIIVLLILAGVSIAILTGQNGILNQAQKAKEQTEYKSAEEKVKLAIMGAKSDDGQMTVDELSREIGYAGGSVTGTSFPVEIRINEHTFIIERNGLVENNTLGTITGYEITNTTVKDSLGNIVKVPAGFKIVNPTDTVPNGIIIQDVDENRLTFGSEFVWIPVGTVTKANGETEQITLGRYNFDSSGNPTEYNNNAFCTEDTEATHPSTCLNTIAKNIDTFKEKVSTSNGYYIGRYEARDKVASTARTNSASNSNPVVCTAKNYVYNWVTQQQAAQLSRNMYTGNNFESDLMNSYAWDTAIVYLQKFDTRENKKPYSCTNSINSTLAIQGTNKDEICNVYDMASNVCEWTTETCLADNYNTVARADSFLNKKNFCTAIRDTPRYKF